MSALGGDSSPSTRRRAAAAIALMGVLVLCVWALAWSSPAARLARSVDSVTVAPHPDLGQISLVSRYVFVPGCLVKALPAFAAALDRGQDPGTVDFIIERAHYLVQTRMDLGVQHDFLGFAAAPRRDPLDTDEIAAIRCFIAAAEAQRLEETRKDMLDEIANRIGTHRGGNAVVGSRSAPPPPAPADSGF